MSKISLDDLLKHADNEYRLVLMAAKRARQLHNQFKPLVKSDSKKDTIIALEEIAAGKVHYKKRELLGEPFMEEAP